MARRRSLAKPPEIAAYLRVSERTLDDWVQRGVGPRFTYVGQMRRYRWEDVEDYLRQRDSGGRVPA